MLFPEDVALAARELPRLRRELPAGIEICLGTLYASGREQGAHVFPSRSALASVSDATSCDTDPDNDEASTTFTVGPLAAAPAAAAEEDSGCGCRLAPASNGDGWAVTLSLVLSGLAVRRRARRAPAHVRR